MVPVVAHLNAATLKDLHQSQAGVLALAAGRQEILFAELGAHAWRSGRWSNGVGQVELYVNATGLKVLAASSNAVSFWPGKGWIERSGLDNSDGRLDALERALSAGGFVDVELVPNVDGLAFEVDRSGAAQFGSVSMSSLRSKAGELFARLSPSQQSDRAAALARLSDAAATAPNAAPVTTPITARLSREGVVQLALDGSIRSIRLAGFKDSRLRKVDADVQTLLADSAASSAAEVEVLLTLRDPMVGGRLSQASLDSRKAATRHAFDQLFFDAGIDAKQLKDLSLFSAMAGRLSARQLQALVNSADDRILSIELNRPVAYASLATSTGTLNMPSAWNAGYIATGQNVIVMDTGTQANHAFLRNTAGTSRVVFEACFGSNAAFGGVNYQSVCPSANAVGDSPLGLVESGAPVLSCSSAFPSQCDHGTHVAGIASGQSSAFAPPGVQGVAPGANVVAVQVFSFDQQRVQRPVVFNADLIMAMEAAVSGMPAGSTANPYTINLSLGGGQNSSACGAVSQAFTNATLTLKNLGIPVIAATGNNFYTGQVAWPACTPGVVQVSSVANDGVGNTRSNFGGGSGANLARPSQFPAAYIWLAPGGGNSTAIVSSRVSAPGTASYSGLQGTSQAAPHVTGIYAAVKAGIPGVTVDGVSEWIRGNARVQVLISMCVIGPCVPSDTVNYDRIRIPNL